MYICLYHAILKAFIKITKATRNSSDILANLLQLHLHVAVATNNNRSNYNSNSNKNEAMSEAAACCLTLEWYTRYLAAAFQDDASTANGRRMWCC